MSHGDRRLVVHIERLVLEGLPLRAADGPLVQAALETELARLLAEGDLASAFDGGGAIASLPPVDLASPAAPEPPALGVQVAHALYGTLGPSGDAR
jgi:hypothetical protein